MHHAECLHRALSGDRLSWLHFGNRALGVSTQHARRQRKTACRLLKGLYGMNPVPGIILGDEVGMGKTYETFGVIATLLRHQPNARIVVLAHSGSMANTWLRRWNHFRLENVASKHRENMAVGELLRSADEIGKPGLFFGSYETFKIASTRHLRAMLEWVFHGSGLHKPTRRRWRWQLFGERGPGDDPRDHFPSCPSRKARLGSGWPMIPNNSKICRTWKNTGWISVPELLPELLDLPESKGVLGRASPASIPSGCRSSAGRGLGHSSTRM